MIATPRPVRYRCEVLARLELPPWPGVKVRVLELSQSGAFLEEPEGIDDVQVGDRATFTMPLPGGELWHAAATVARLGLGRREVKHHTVQQLTVSVPGIALAFAQLSDERRVRLARYLDTLEER